jgi:hypothetical protein
VVIHVPSHVGIDRSCQEGRRDWCGDVVVFAGRDLGKLVLVHPLAFYVIEVLTWAGKYTYLDEMLQLLKLGGVYVIDDMLPQATWPEGHSAEVERLIAALESRRDSILTKMNWGSGIVVATPLLSAQFQAESSG